MEEKRKMKEIEVKDDKGMLDYTIKLYVVQNWMIVVMKEAIEEKEINFQMINCEGL